MNIDEQIDWFARRTPSHLKGVVSNDCPELGLGVGGHGEEIAVGYRLKCECGSKIFEVSAYLWQRDSTAPSTLISPVRASCPDCENRILVFDSDKHGYDPVACETTSLAHGEKEEAAIEKVIAPKSNPATVDIVAYYPDDLFDEGFEQFTDRRNDLFTWLKIVVGENTEPDYPFLSFECA